MHYENFRQEIIEKHGELFSAHLENFFTKAVELATNEHYEDAILVGNDAMVFAKYSGVGYEILYLIGMLCQAHLDNGHSETAEKYFKFGMEIIEGNKKLNTGTYEEDINSFLDLKIVIDSELKKKSGV